MSKCIAIFPKSLSAEILIYFFLPCMKYAKNHYFCHWKVKICVFQFIFRCFPPLDQRCPFDNEISPHIYTLYVKGILGQGGGGAPKNKLKDRNFNFSIINIILFSIFPMHAQKEDITL